MKFYTMIHYITSFNKRKIFTMNSPNTSLKYKKEFKQIYSCIFYLKRCKKFFKLHIKFIECMHIADEKPIQPFFHLNTSNTCQNSGNSLPIKWILKHKLKGILKNLLHLNFFTLTKKTLVRKETGSLTNIKVYNGRSYCGIFDRSRCNYPIYCLDFWKTKSIWKENK